ncbi:MAG: ABC-type transport system, permease component [Porphyrobacter sp. HL-46]|nr:MAG: ABC-type transport system, permease component [Porphyrobacter sp. HL-46]
MNDARSIGDVVNRVREIAEGRDTVSVGDLVDEFGDHSFAPLMLIIALIGMTPVGAIPTAPTILGLCIAIVAVQFAAGREHVWLPRFIECRSVSSRKLKQGSDKLDRVARMLDIIAKGRLPALTGINARRTIAGLIVLLCCALPLLEVVPFAAAAPFFAIATLSLAMIVRDGLVMLVGGGVALGGLAYGIRSLAI